MLTRTTLLNHFNVNIKKNPESQRALTDGGDNRGSKDDSIWPVPVVEGLTASNSDPLARSIGHHLRTRK